MAKNIQKTTEYKLGLQIMEYWFKCISKKNDRYADGDINELLEEFVHDCNVSYHSDDLDRTVLNLTNSQKRKLYKMMLDSGVLER
ncbi:hypothetical protein FMM74_017340 [Lachnospiraceae bacterium MD308]|nr:hypothetical protein [Lachnospiraceae bacterium MD308]